MLLCQLDPEDGDSMFLRNVVTICKLVHNIMGDNRHQQRRPAAGMSH